MQCAVTESQLSEIGIAGVAGATPGAITLAASSVIILREGSAAVLPCTFMGVDGCHDVRALP